MNSVKGGTIQHLYKPFVGFRVLSPMATAQTGSALLTDSSAPTDPHHVPNAMPSTGLCGKLSDFFHVLQLSMGLTTM